MPRAQRLRRNPQVIAALEQLEDALPAGASDSLRRRVRALIRLHESRTDGEIAEEIDVTRQYVNKLRAAARHGIQRIIADVRKRVDKLTTEKAKRPHAGSPSIASLEEWRAKQHPEAEPVIEWVVLCASEYEKVSLLGFRPADGPTKEAEATAAAELLEKIRVANHREERTAWTTSGFDDDADFVFSRLKTASSDTAPPPAELCAVTYIADALQTFSQSWSFVLLHSTPLPAQLECSDRIRERIEVPPDRFLDAVEGLTYSLRVTLNLQGLFPTFGGLKDHVSSQTSTVAAACDVAWRVHEDTIDQRVAHRQVEFYLYALGGLVFELPAAVHQKLRWQESFPVEQLALRPRIRIEDHADSSTDATVTYEPVPQAGYRFLVQHRGDSAKFAAGLRRALRDHRHRLQFEYSVRIGRDQARSAFPEELAQGRLAPRPRDRVALVSVPRQWITAEPQVPLAEIVARARTPGGGQESTGLFFAIPELLEAIRSAYEQNRYGDLLQSIYRFDQHMAEVPFAVRPRLNPRWWPFYHFSREELAGAINIKTLERLTNCPIDFHETREFGNPGGPSGTLFPGYDAERTFTKLLTEFDADFLLREIDDVAWENLLVRAREWTSSVSEIIAQNYWPGSRPAEELILRTITADWRAEARIMWDHVETWASDALSEFNCRVERLLRETLEIAQRCRVAGLPATAAVLVSEQDLLRRWRSFLGLSLKRRVVEELRLRGQIEAVERSASARSNRRRGSLGARADDQDDT